MCALVHVHLMSFFPRDCLNKAIVIHSDHFCSLRWTVIRYLLCTSEETPVIKTELFLPLHYLIS